MLHNHEIDPFFNLEVLTSVNDTLIQPLVNAAVDRNFLIDDAHEAVRETFSLITTNIVIRI